MEEIKMPRMRTLKEVAAETGLSYSLLRKLCIQGKIVHIRTGAKYLINMDKFIQFLNEGVQ